MLEKYSMIFIAMISIIVDVKVIISRDEEIDWDIDWDWDDEEVEWFRKW